MHREWRRPDKGFFEEIEKEFEEMDELIRRMVGSDMPLVYGFSFHAGPDGVPHVERFGNAMPALEEGGGDIREPFAGSMIDEKNSELKITAEMPGVGKEDIQVNATGSEVVIKAEGGGRKYQKIITTPSPVDPDSAKANYNNGVLEVTLKLKEPPKKKGRTVKIE